MERMARLKVKESGNYIGGLSMTDSEFARLADDTLARIEAALDDCAVDIDCEVHGGVVQLTFPNGSQNILNKPCFPNLARSTNDKRLTTRRVFPACNLFFSQSLHAIFFLVQTC
jgi:hypothetical protein